MCIQLHIILVGLHKLSPPPLLTKLGKKFSWRNRTIYRRPLIYPTTFTDSLYTEPSSWTTMYIEAWKEMAWRVRTLGNNCKKKKKIIWFRSSILNLPQNYNFCIGSSHCVYSLGRLGICNSPTSAFQVLDSQIGATTQNCQTLSNPSPIIVLWKTQHTDFLTILPTRWGHPVKVIFHRFGFIFNSPLIAI